jgi:hypothetical protein
MARLHPLPRHGKDQVMYDVEIRELTWPHNAWSNDTTTGSKATACRRARQLAKHNRVLVRVIDHLGTRYDYLP